jgi:hypothetical protein
MVDVLCLDWVADLQVSYFVPIGTPCTQRYSFVKCKVDVTLDREAYYRRCLGIIADTEDAEDAFSGLKPYGLLKIDIHGNAGSGTARPRAAQFSSQHREAAFAAAEIWA